ncbi:MAG: insulinase family protein [Clostridiales bacterium]|jgi:predicted Zn-dependent peptidase|nr:insulinase family protein [Clostridiales bacterium]
MFNEFTLQNGVRVICERMESVRSVAVGVWVGAGSRFERAEHSGVSHFIEHMLFKGTRSRTAKQIAEEIDAIGGQINAFTFKDCTCFYTKTLDIHLAQSLDILSDILLNSKLTKPDINLERGVILEEINMYEDSPEDLVHDLLTESVWRDSPLGMPILGTAESLVKIDKTVLRQYLTEKYIPQNVVISVAGSFDPSALRQTLERKFRKLKASGEAAAPVSDHPRYAPGARIRQKDTEQVHLCLGLPGIEIGNDDNYALHLVNSIFGGGMSSVLFQKIREDLGLVYSIYSYLTAHRHAGLFTVYAGMQLDRTERVLNMIVDELRTFRASGMTGDLLEKSKEQFKGNFLMGLESVNARMTSIGKSELLLGYVNTPDEIVQKVEAVTLEKAYEVTERVFALDKIAISAVGCVDDRLEQVLRSF